EEAKAAIIEAGKKTGELTLEDVTEKLASFEMEPEQFEEFLDQIEAQEIEMDRKEEADPKAEKEEQFDLNDLSVPPGVRINDPVRMYLKEIGRVDLLTGKEEVDLAIRIIDGLAAEAELEETGKMTPKIDADIIRGENAKKKLAEANLRLVVSIAKRYVGRGMLFLDLIQEGNMGLIKAVEKFDHTKGFKFSTY